MIVKKGTFVFNCTNKGGIPMILEKCSKCKLAKKCTVRHAMDKMNSELEHDIRYEINDTLFQKYIGG